MKKVHFTVALLAIGLLAACSSPQNHDLYYWGNYSDVVYSYYNEEGDLSKQEEALNQIIAQAKEQNKLIAPGVYGHLGLVLLKQGKPADANMAFQEEQRLYPESTTFMQYLQRKK
ncbi:DUF4810 domain-containing protein [Pasteurella canis]|uniref:Lipoprotein n=1 Tax=Pasteurella canis TaxID=753 RepID=A0ABQ4VF77_9PAST|nr:DUF4810 domain-containing protein [Pasteurella canis]MXN89370.1 DUF4810 domain-containing protein [Pasteurella canis]UAX41759.1 DUF4810 domain-containing protein [Pasteurella canis]UDW83316.1 DUF4810 domain-containing protein [Pasteurella canis]UEC22843.1 DUF4810 domain-containing protein [Pasteurella canis]SPY38392.1 Uncharacterised protein [Pasteurella canis]